MAVDSSVATIRAEADLVFVYMFWGKPGTLKFIKQSLHSGYRKELVIPFVELLEA
jgi:hypothetical protein